MFRTACLLLGLISDILGFGQPVTYREIMATPDFTAAGNGGAIFATGSDGRLWAVFGPGNTAVANFYAQNPTAPDSLQQIGSTITGYYMGLGIVNGKEVSRFADGQLHIYMSSFSPRGSDYLVGLLSIPFNFIATAEITSAGATLVCTSYVVNGGKDPLTQYVPSGPFPSYDGKYYYVGTSTTSNNNTVTTSSTLFELVEQNAATKVCNLSPTVSLDHEIVQAMKVDINKFLVETTVHADTFNPITEIGELTTNGAYAPLVGSTQFTRCCSMVQDWTNKSAAITGVSSDGVTHTVIYPGLQEVFNSGVNSQLTANIGAIDLKGTRLILGGSNRGQYNDELVAVDTKTKNSYVIATYDNITNLPKVLPPLVYIRRSAAVTPDGTGYLVAYQASNKTQYAFEATIPGFTAVPVPPAPTFTNIVARPSLIAPGASATLTWSTQNASSVTIDQGIGTVPISGTMNVSPVQTTVYTLTATGSGGTATVRVIVTVTSPPPPTINAVVNGASFTAGPLAPGGIFTVEGTGFGSGTGSATAVSLSLGGTSVTVCGKPARLYFASPNQLNVVAPNTTPLGSCSVVVTMNGVFSAPATVQVVAANGALFLWQPDPNNPKQYAGIITDNLNFALAGHQANPFAPGEAFVLWGTLYGATNPPVDDSIPSPPGLFTLATAPTITIDGIPSQCPFAGRASGFASIGLDQINCIVPLGLSPGPHQLLVGSIPYTLWTK